MIPTVNIRHERTVLTYLKDVDVLILFSCWHLGTEAEWLSEAEDEFEFEWDRWRFLSYSCFNQPFDFPLSAGDEAFCTGSRTRCDLVCCLIFLSDDSMWWSITASWGTTVTGKSGRLAVKSSNIWDGSDDVFMSEAAGLTTSEHQATSSRILKLLVKSMPFNAQSILKCVVCLLSLNTSLHRQRLSLFNH